MWGLKEVQGLEKMEVGVGRGCREGRRLKERLWVEGRWARSNARKHAKEESKSRHVWGKGGGNARGISSL